MLAAGYATVAWILLCLAGQQKDPEAGRMIVLSGILVLNVGMWPLYLGLRKRKSASSSARTGALWIFIATVASPNLLQTDQLRYVWDGLMAAQGQNPYALTPRQALAWQHELTGKQDSIVSPRGFDIPDEWARRINHPQLPTVYPPAAQLAFEASSWLNPFFVLPAAHSLIPAVQRLLPPRQALVWELGWRIMIGMSAALLVFLLRNQRWDLVVFHPLYLLTAVANVHTEALLLPLLALALRHRQGVWPPGLALGLAIMTRWTPGILAPQIFLETLRRSGIKSALWGLAGALSVCAIGIALYWGGSGGRMFESVQTFGAQWMFFGFAHRWLADTLGYFGVASSIDRAKLILGIVFSCGWMALFALQCRKRMDLRLTCLLTFVLMLVVSPTLHPWYLLPLVLLGLPYHRILATPWIWPLLAPFSYVFYYTGTDPAAFRHGVYAVVCVLLLRDGVIIFRHIRRKTQTNLQLQLQRPSDALLK
jgi:hypothetical protein